MSDELSGRFWTKFAGVGAWIAGTLLAFALALCVAPRAARAQTATPDVTIAPPPDLARFSGRIVTKVDVVLDDDTWSDVTVPTVSVIRHGETFEPEVARRAMNEVLDTGKYARGRVSVAADGAGVRVIVHVVARKLIESLSVDVHGAEVDVDEVTRAADLAEGGEIVGVNVETAKKAIADVLARHGYPAATAAITTRATDDPQKVLVFVDVQPGVPRLLAKRFFYISDPELSTLESFVEGHYAVGTGERADDAALEAADTKLEGLLRGRGYQRADVSHDVAAWQKQWVLRVRVDTGPLFSPRFEGNDHYDATALGGALDLENETDLSTGHLVQKVRDFYVKRGYLDVEVTAETRGGDADRVHLLVFKIREHARVGVTTRAYPCLKEDEIRRLREAPDSASAIGTEIDSFLEEDLPGADLVKDPDPQGLDATIGPGAGQIQTGARPVPVDLEPTTVYAADSYERAVAHVQELYRNEGFLSAQVGPVQVVRRRCSARSPAGQCVPISPTIAPAEVCTYDATNLPLPVAPLDPAFSCTPDPLHGVECEPRVSLRIPVKLGPRTTLYDLQFTGVTAFSEQRVADAAAIALGDPANTLRLDDARRRVLDLYKEWGYAYADVKYTLESSVDHTRARARFEIVEGDQVIVKDIVIRGNRLTHEGTIRRRIALEVGQPYRTSSIRKTQERLATLNVFSSVTVGLGDPYVPQKNKTVVITLVESVPQAVGLEAGFTTGQGFYTGIEYAHRNLGGLAVGFSIRGQIAYLPDVFLVPPLVDQQVYINWRNLSTLARVAGRITASLTIPEIGLGPLVRTQLDLIGVHDLQRDFYISKVALIPSAQYRPIRELAFSLSQSFEYNVLNLFQYNTLADYLNSLAAAQGSAPSADIVKYLLFPQGPSDAFAQRFVVTWDRRDDSFNASRGTYFLSGVEHVDSFGLDPQQNAGIDGHFLRFTETFAGYIPLPRGMRIAAELRVGANVQLTDRSQTYPDRLFFMGGPDSMRGWTLRSFVPQDDIDQIRATAALPDCVPKPATTPGSCNGDATGAPNPNKYTLDTQPVRGGNLMINPRLELRIPVRNPFEIALFTDVGNLWRKASYPFDTGQFKMRASVGAGLRVQTPVGPLALDYGINVTRDDVYAKEDPGALSFQIGLY